VQVIKRLKKLLSSAQEGPRHPTHYVRQTVDPRRQAAGKHALKIVCLDVDHGDATLIILPSGRVALIDSAKEAWCRKRVIPFLQNHEIGEVSYYINTHYHEDHVGEKARIIREFHVKHVWDYKSFQTGAELEFEGTKLQIQNSYDDGREENDRSLAFRLEYEGFVYSHGADVYAEGQERILSRFGPEVVRSHVYRTNHHLHGSISREYLLASDPHVFVISAQEAVYQRIAYTRDFKEVVAELMGSSGRLRDICLTLERGNMLIYANSADDWGYASYRPHIILAGLYP